MANSQRSLQDYNAYFLDVLESLNPEQKRAVQQIDGPMLVVAGPGTGKTHILAARIGKILLDTDTQPNNILCLTFTEAGVIAMRDRLIQFIGPEAHRVHIFTFHSFCNTIIQDNLELFGRQDMEPLSELDRIDLIRKLLDTLAQNHPLRQGISDPYFYENHLFELFQRMKMENWTTAHVIEQVGFYLEDLINYPTFVYQRKSGRFKKGDLKEAKVAEVELRMQKLIAAAELYPKYEDAKYLARRYDYTDMILWVLNAFQTEEYLLRNYQEQYLYILVDEYQDTNGSQNELIQQLSAYWDLPNIFIVGDDDQSIYEFQGARLKNLTDFHQQYLDDIELVVLKQNYRSTQNLLDAAKTLIDRNEIRVIHKLSKDQLHKKLIAKGKFKKKEERKAQILEFPNRQQELAYLLSQIRKLKKEKQNLNEVAIIYARHQQVEVLKKLLQASSIPYHTRRRINVLETPLVQKLLNLLNYFDMESRNAFSGEHLLFEILHFDFLRLDTEALAQLSFYLAALPPGARSHWRELINSKKRLENVLNKKEASTFIELGQKIEKLLSIKVNEQLPLFFEALLHHLQVLPFILKQDNKVEGLQVLSAFFNFIKEEARKVPTIKVSTLLKTVKRMNRNRIILPIDTSLDAEEGVQLITAHSAKGLEFEYVFLIDCVKKSWEPRARASSYQFTFPPTLSFSGEEDALEARRRLFYVAMTRAKKVLQASYAKFDEKGKALQRALFIDEILEETDFEEKSVRQASLIENQIAQLRQDGPVNIEAREKATIDKLLESFRMSISAMNTYLRCPLSFYYIYVLKVPGLMSEAAAYGTAMHNALERLFVKMQKSRPRNFPGQKDFIAYFEFEMNLLKIYFTEENYEQRLQKGRYVLGQYYQHHYGQWHKRVVVEYKIRSAEVEGVPLTGTIDKLEFKRQQKVHIVDYKTGSHKAEKLRRPTKTNPHGGAYWRQLVFYKLLYENFDQTGRIAKSGAIAYLDPDKNGNFQSKELEYEAKDLTQVRSMIKETYIKIKEHQFYEGCGLADCHWCNFVKTHIIPQKIVAVEIEELDD